MLFDRVTALLLVGAGLYLSEVVCYTVETPLCCLVGRLPRSWVLLLATGYFFLLLVGFMR
jgi:hypothetical protein